VLLLHIDFSRPGPARAPATSRGGENTELGGVSRVTAHAVGQGFVRENLARVTGDVGIGKGLVGVVANPVCGIIGGGTGAMASTARTLSADVDRTPWETYASSTQHSPQSARRERDDGNAALNSFRETAQRWESGGLRSRRKNVRYGQGTDDRTKTPDQGCDRRPQK
jgi:hypothetical protein